jgi:hypothetical protein
MPENISITFTEREVQEILAEYYGDEPEEMQVGDYTEEEIKTIILDRIL